MIKHVIRFALLASVSTAAFDNGGKWKVDADGKLALDGDGNPIYVKSDGSEQSVKGDTIANLNNEAKTHRERAEKAEGSLKAYTVDGKVLDPETAKKAVATVANIDAKKLIDAGEVDKVREQMRSEFTSQLADKDKAIEGLTGTNKTLLIDRAFDGSDFVRDRLAVPKDMFRDSFGKNVRIGDDGKTEYYGRDGNRLLSKKHAGEYAMGDEAFELMVEQHPQKDTILKADAGGGSGNGGGGGNRPGGRTMRRADFDKLNPAQQAETAGAIGKGEMSLVD